MATKWKAPKGFVLGKHEGYTINTKGFRAAEGDEPMQDGRLGVAWFNDDEPFDETNSPNVQILPISDGWVPPVYTLHSTDEAPKKKG